MTGTKEMRCRCGKRWSVSSLRNPENEFICPECAARDLAILRKGKPICTDNYQCVVVLLNGAVQASCPM